MTVLSVRENEIRNADYYGAMIAKLTRNYKWFSKQGAVGKRASESLRVLREQLMEAPSLGVTEVSSSLNSYLADVIGIHQRSQEELWGLYEEHRDQKFGRRESN